MTRAKHAWRYGLAILGVAAAFGLKLAVTSLDYPIPRFMLFGAVVGVTAWYCGLGPGLLAALLGAVAGSYFVVFPAPVIKPGIGQNLIFFEFLLAGSFIGWLTHELRRASRTAREQKDQFRLLVESTPEFAAFLLDPDGRVASWNAGAERVLGWPAAEALGTPFARLCPAGAVGPGLPRPPDGRAAGAGWHTRRDGSRIWCERIVTALPGGDGRAVGFVAVVRDASDRRRAEAAVRLSERRLSLVLDATSEGVWDWNVPTGEVYYSPHWAESLGYSPAEVPPHVSFWEGIIHPDDMPRVREALRAHFEGRTPVYECENRLRTKAGGWRWNLDRGKVVERGPGGKPVRMVGTAADISERKRAEEELRASEALNRAVLASLSARIAIIDRAGVIVAVNEAWDEFARDCGASPLAATRPGADYLAVCRQATRRPEDAASLALAGVEGVLAGREARFVLEYPCPAPAEVCWFEMVIEPLRRPEGGAVVAHTDITPRKLAEQALRASEARFRRLAEADIVGVGYGDSARRVYYANGELLRILGRTAADIQAEGLDVAAQTPAEYHALDQAKLAEVRARGACAPYEKEYTRPGGERVPVWIGAALVDPGADEVMGIVVDLTERERAKAEAEYRRRQFELIADALPVLISYIDKDRRYQFNNAAYQRWFGLPREAIQGRPVREIIGEAGYETIRVQIGEALAGRPQSFDNRIADHEGTIRDVHVEYIPHRDDGGAVVGFYVLVMDISDRRRAEEAIRASEEKYRRIVETANEGIWQLDADARVTFANSRMGEMLGYRPDELVGRVKWDFLFPEDMARERELFDRRREGVSEHVDVRFRHRDGRGVWALMSARAVADGTGRFQGALDMFTDLTDRKRAEEAIRASEEKYRRIVETANEGIWQVDADAQVTFANSRMGEMLGYRPDELVGRVKWDFLFPEDVARGRELFDRRREGVSEHVDVRFRHRDGRGVWTLMSARAVADGTGRFQGALDMFTDVTDRKRAEEALHRSEARLSAIVRTAADAIITIDARGVIETVNPAAEQMFGYTAGEMVGREVSMLIPSPYREEHDTFLEEYRHTGVARMMIGHGRPAGGLRKDGSTFPLELSVSEIAQHGVFTGILRDVSARKELEREVLEAGAAEQRRIGQELHDSVGQELTGLGLLAAALARRAADRDPANAAMAARIAEGLGRAHRSVRALSRGLVPVEVDPEGLRAALDELAARTCEQSGTECVFEPGGAVAVEDTGTATHLLRIAQEAVSNALRHGRPARIGIALRADPGQLVLEVRDDGVGLQAVPGGEGGLGIRLMRYRAGLIGGTLAVGPADGHGTLVRCVIPRRDHHVAGQPEPGGEGPPGDDR